MFELKGIIPPMVTPFDANGDIVYADFESNLDRYLEVGVTGYLVLGSNGEAVYLEHDEKLRLIEAARKRIPDSMLLLAGTGLESTRATIELTREAAERGVDGVLVKNPSYYKSRMDRDAYLAHFTAVADASPVPIVLYNVPMFTGISMAADVVIDLSRHPNIHGLKESAGNVQLISEVVWSAPADGFSVLAGSAQTLYPNMMAGARGGIVALACAAPAAMLALYRAVVDGDYPRAARLQRILAPSAVAVTAKYGVAGLKAAMETCGFRSGLPRRPLLPCDDTARRDLEETFRMHNQLAASP